MKPISPFGLPIGLSALVWVTVAFFRYISENVFGKKPKPFDKNTKYKPKDLAVIIPAHNEEIGIAKTINSLKNYLRPKQIYVASDGSSDRTAIRAKKTGVHVSELNPGQGKAKALKYLIKHYRLLKRFKLILILDADTQVDRRFIKYALPYFDDPEIATVFAGTKIVWPHHIIPRLKWYFVSYRDRLNRLLVFFYIYGQTWKYTNVNYVVPGSCTIYRSDIMEKLPLDTPGLLIEDFNTAFQLYKLKLGKMAYHPILIQWEHYPDNLGDYWRQVRRWNIGFFQTIKKNGIWPSFFWLTLGIFITEVMLNAIFIFFLPVVILFLLINSVKFVDPWLYQLTYWYQRLGLFKNISLLSILFGIYLWDYFLTAIVATQQRKPQMLFYGLFYFFMHYVTVLILLTSIIPGLFTSSSGRWISPTRRKGV